MDCVELQRGLFVDCKAWHIQFSKLSDNCSSILQESWFADVTNSGFRERNIEICAVLSFNKVDLLMRRNRVFRQRNDQKCAVLSWKDFDYLKLRNRVLRLRDVHIRVVPPCYVVEFRFSGIAFSGFEFFLEGRRSADIHEFCFQAAKRSDMDCVDLQVGLFADCQEWHFKSRNVQIIGVPSCRRVELLMFTNSGFKVRNVEICAVLSSNEVGLQILRNRVFRQRNDKIWAMPLRKDFDLLILSNHVLRLGIVHIWVVPPCYVVDLLILRNRV